jgi:hypothetical protein
MLYKTNDELEYKCDIKQDRNIVVFDFEADCGKHHTFEPVAEIKIPINNLYNLLTKWLQGEE